MLGTKQIALSILVATTVVGGGTGVYLLSQDRTIEHKLIREGINLINNKDEYEIAFIERKSDSEFTKLIGNFNSKSEIGGNALEKWCKDNLKLNLSETNIKNILPKAKDYCSKPSSNIEERYTKIGKKLVQKNKWKDQYKTLKKSNTRINTELELGEFQDDPENIKAGDALKKWCNSKIKTPLVKDKTEEIWKKVQTNCLQK